MYIHTFLGRFTLTRCTLKQNISAETWWFQWSMFKQLTVNSLSEHHSLTDRLIWERTRTPSGHINVREVGTLVHHHCYNKSVWEISSHLDIPQPTVSGIIAQCSDVSDSEYLGTTETVRHNVDVILLNKGSNEKVTKNRNIIIQEIILIPVSQEIKCFRLNNKGFKNNVLNVPTLLPLSFLFLSLSQRCPQRKHTCRLTVPKQEKCL